MECMLSKLRALGLRMALWNGPRKVKKDDLEVINAAVEEIKRLRTDLERVKHALSLPPDELARRLRGDEASEEE